MPNFTIRVELHDAEGEAAGRTYSLHRLTEKPWVLVTKAADARRWSGLKKVR